MKLLTGFAENNNLSNNKAKPDSHKLDKLQRFGSHSMKRVCSIISLY